MSYVIRRIWTVEPREARRAATLIAEIGRIYEEHGRRGPSTVYFNGSTLPGDTNQVFDLPPRKSSSVSLDTPQGF